MGINTLRATLLLSALSTVTGHQVVTQDNMRVMKSQNEGAETPRQGQVPRAPGNPMAKFFGNGFPSGSRGRQRRSGPGWTQAQVQRRARKARNVRRHRAHCKGK